MIETKRLRLRPHGVEDLERYLPLYTRPEPPGTVLPMVLSEEDAWYRLLRFVGHWSHFGYGLFLVEDLGRTEIVGEVGFAHFHRGIGPHFDTVPEAGWRILQHRRGEGIAAEAMQAALDWFDARIAPARTVCMIHPDNIPSLKVAARLDYREFGRGVYKNEPTLLLERIHAARGREFHASTPLEDDR